MPQAFIWNDVVGLWTNNYVTEPSSLTEIVNIFKIITYLQNTVSIYPISSDPRYDMVPKDELDIDNSNKISFLNKNPFFDLFCD